MSNRTDLIEVAQIAVNVKDLARATTFYRDVLGLALELEAPGLAFFRCGAVRLMPSRAERSEYDHPTSIIYYRVADIEAAHAALRPKVHFISAPTCVHRDARHQLWLAGFHDSEGNTLELFCERPAA
jgi:catechol-2,3-dioxygenase